MNDKTNTSESDGNSKKHFCKLNYYFYLNK